MSKDTRRGCEIMKVLECRATKVRDVFVMEVREFRNVTVKVCFCYSLVCLNVGDSIRDSVGELALASRLSRRVGGKGCVCSAL